MKTINQRGRHGRRYSIWAFVILSSFVIRHSSFALQVIDLGYFPGDTQSIAYAINDRDQVVGTTSSADFLWENGGLKDITDPFQEYYSTGINNAGQIACGAAGSDGIIYPALRDLYGPSPITILGNLGGVSFGQNGYAIAINSTGQSAGVSWVDATHPHAFFHDGKAMLDLGLFLTAGSSAALDVNDAGAVVGSSADGPFLYADGTMTILRPFGTTQAEARAINNKGQVVGDCTLSGGNHAFIYEGEAFRDLGDWFPWDINDAGTVVGWRYVKRCRACTAEEHGVKSEVGSGKWEDLNDLLPAGSPWVISYAFGINASGKIVGGAVRDGQLHAVMMVP